MLLKIAASAIWLHPYFLSLSGLLLAHACAGLSPSLSRDEELSVSRRGLKSSNDIELGWTGWFTAEDGGQSEIVRRPISGLARSGRNSSFSLRFQYVKATESSSFLELTGPVGTSNAFFTDGELGAHCMHGDVVVGAVCYKAKCERMQLLCRRIGPRAILDDDESAAVEVVALRPTDIFGEQGGDISRSCPKGHYVTGIRCTGEMCDSLYVKCRQVKENRTYFEPPGSEVSSAWGAWFSEEGRGSSPGDEHMPFSEISCQGGWCDNMSLYKVVSSEGDFLRAITISRMNGTVSEAQSNRTHEVCGDNQLVTKIECSGRYCASLRLTCGTIDGSRAKMDNINTIVLQQPLSEKDGNRVAACPPQHYVGGVSCEHFRCANKRLMCKRVVPLAGASFDTASLQAKSAEDVHMEAEKIKPIWKFDQDAGDFCFPDDRRQRDARNGICQGYSRTAPTFVNHKQCSQFQVYQYVLWYGWQSSCSKTYVNGRIGDPVMDWGLFNTTHDDDNESIELWVQDGKVKKVRLSQHNGHYFVPMHAMHSENGRPVIYVGKSAHGSYHRPCNGRVTAEVVAGALHGFTGTGYNEWPGSFCPGGCGYWDDFRNPGDGRHTLDQATVIPDSSLRDIDCWEGLSRECTPGHTYIRSSIGYDEACWGVTPMAQV